MGWLIALGIVALLLFIPIGISAIYNQCGPSVSMILGPIRISVYPRVKKSKDKLSKDKKRTSGKSSGAKEKSGGSVLDFKLLLDLVLDLLTDLRRKLRVERLELKLILANDDPCDLAVNYGRAWTALGNLMPTLERYFVIKKREMEVECDFTAQSTIIFARVDLTLTLCRVLSLGAWHGFRLLREYFRIMNQRKGGAKT